MIELTSGYISNSNPKFLINPAHIIYIQTCDQSKNPSYNGVTCYVEYIGGNENQVVYVKETYNEIKALLK